MNIISAFKADKVFLNFEFNFAVLFVTLLIICKVVLQIFVEDTYQVYICFGDFTIGKEEN